MSINLIELMTVNYNKEFAEEIENKFMCPSKFTQEIEKLVHTEEKMSYIDAVVHYCEQHSIDLESAPKLISKPLKEKIKYEAMELNFLKKTSRARLKF